MQCDIYTEVIRHDEYIKIYNKRTHGFFPIGDIDVRDEMNWIGYKILVEI